MIMKCYLVITLRFAAGSAEGRVDCGFLCLPTDPQLILQKIPYKVIIKPLEKPVFRKIGVAMKSKKTASAVTKKFLEYLKYRS